MAQSEAHSETTVDHDEIRKWAEERGGCPTSVKGTGTKKGAGILRLDFEPKDEKLKEISWNEFFEKFDKEGLAFLYQEKTAHGEVSRFHKFIERHQAGSRSTKKPSGGAKSSGAAKAEKTGSRSKSAGAAKSPAASKAATGTKTAGAKQTGSKSKSSSHAQEKPVKRASSKKS